MPYRAARGVLGPSIWPNRSGTVGYPQNMDPRTQNPNVFSRGVSADGVSGKPPGRPMISTEGISAGLADRERVSGDPNERRLIRRRCPHGCG